MAGDLVHETTLFAEPIFNIGSFTVTNTIINSAIALVIVLLIFILVRKKLTDVPRGWQNFMEIIIDGALSLVDTVTGDRKKSLLFMPLVMSFFFFILINNWLGLLPGVGSIGIIEEMHGKMVFVPLLRGATADLNTTLALSIVAVIATHVFGVFLTSFWSHLNRFISLDLIIELPKKVFVQKEFTALLVNPIKFFVGLIEIIGEVSKMASLSFRLFGNVFAGEVLLGVMASIFAYAVPIPFMFLELLVGFIQALIFSMLTLVFLTVMSTSHDEHDHDEKAAVHG